MWQNAHTLSTYASYCALIGLSSGAYFGLIPSVLARIVGMKQYLYISGSMAWMFMAVGTLLGTLSLEDWQRFRGHVRSNLQVQRPLQLLQVC